MNGCTGGDWRYEVERYGVLLYEGHEVEEHQYVIEAEGKVIARIDNRLSDAEQEEESLLATKTETSTLLDIQIALVKHVVADKQHQRKLAEEAIDRREKKQKLLALIAEKD